MPQHIKRLIGAFAAVLVLFLVMQQVLKPASFGKTGHYRADAIQENEMKELNYAGSDKCTECHELRSESRRMLCTDGRLDQCGRGKGKPEKGNRIHERIPQFSDEKAQQRAICSRSSCSGFGNGTKKTSRRRS